MSDYSGVANIRVRSLNHHLLFIVENNRTRTHCVIVKEEIQFYYLHGACAVVVIAK